MDMDREQREFMDKEHEVMYRFYDLCEQYNGSNAKFIKRRMKQLIEEDPDFLDSYLLLYEILKDEGNSSEAERVLNDAYERALRLITDENGNWPDRLSWGWLENRHVIRTILNKAILLWENRKVDEALDLLRKLLKTNPGDNVGARFYILAIRMNMTLEEFERRFDRGGYYDMDLSDWFDENYKGFDDEFGWWEKAIEEYM